MSGSAPIADMMVRGGRTPREVRPSHSPYAEVSTNSIPGLAVWHQNCLGGHTQHYDSRLVTSVIYFSYSGREIRLPSRSTRARSFAGREAWISSTRFHGARGVSHVERGTNSDG